jgi:hypothetical protein
VSMHASVLRLLSSLAYHLVGMVKYCCDYATSKFTSKFVTSGIFLAILSGLI